MNRVDVKNMTRWMSVAVEKKLVTRWRHFCRVWRMDHLVLKNQLKQYLDGYLWRCWENGTHKWHILCFIERKLKIEVKFFLCDPILRYKYKYLFVVKGKQK